MNKHTRVVIVSTAASQPRYHRRVSALLKEGCSVTVYTFRRGFYEVNKYPEGAEVVDLGELASGRYLERLPKLALAARVIRQKERLAPTSARAVWTFGLDSALLARLALPNNPKLIYEVGDLRNPEPTRSLRTRIIASAEKWVLARTSLLVVTSDAFVDYYRELAGSQLRNTVVIENKLPSGWFRQGKLRPSPVKPGDPIRLGFVGFLRYPRTLVPLLEAVSKLGPRYELHVHGDGPLRGIVEEYASHCPAIQYHGAFRAPDDLERIYAGLDLSYVVYDNSDVNVMLALPNKLYESLYFGVPLVVAERTMLARRVQSAGAGFVLDPDRADFALSFLERLSAAEIAHASERALQVPVTALIEENDTWLAALRQSIG